MDIGNQIKERRQRLGLSQEELAQRLYVTRVTISHWETSKTLPDVQSMLLLANLFGTTIDEMVRGDVDEMREMVEKGEQQRKAFAIALGAVEVTVIAGALGRTRCHSQRHDGQLRHAAQVDRRRECCGLVPRVLGDRVEPPRVGAASPRCPAP